MQIIDFHTHFFPPELAPRAIARLIENAAPTIAMKNYTDGTVEGLMESMHRGGIAASVTLPVATKPSQVSTINKGCAETAYPGIIQFGTLHPEMEGFEAEIDFLAGSGIKGIKLHPEYQYSYIDNPKIFPMYEKLKVRVRTLFIWGEQDRFLLTGCIEGLDRYFPEVEIERIPDATHWIIHERGTQVAELITRFIGERTAI